MPKILIPIDIPELGADPSAPASGFARLYAKNGELYFRDDGGTVHSLGGVSDHGALSGLSDDDHSQYHNDTRGDARYHVKTDFTDAGGSPPYAGDPVKLDESGLIGASMLPAIATAAEITTGTEIVKYVTPDAFAGSVMGTKSLCMHITGPVEVVDSYARIPIPAWASDTTYPWEIVDIEAFVGVAGTTNSMSMFLNNGTNDINSTQMYIDSGEYRSKDATNQPTLNSSYKSLSGIAFLNLDIVTISTTPAEDLTVMVHIRRP